MNMRGNEKGNINQYLADTISNVFSENIDTEDNGQLFFMMHTVSSSMAAYDAGEYLMTDDKAPVGLLDQLS